MNQFYQIAQTKISKGREWCRLKKLKDKNHHADQANDSVLRKFEDWHPLVDAGINIWGTI